MIQGFASESVLITTPVLLIGGTEIQTLKIARVLVEARYKVFVCCYYEFNENVVSQFKEAGAEVILLGMNREDGLYGLGKQLFKLFKELRPDVVHVQYLAPGFIPIIAARLAGVPTVFATVHIAGSIAYGCKAKFLLRMAARLCTAFFCVSKGVEKFWFGNSELLNQENISGKRRHFTIYNTIDIPKIEQIANDADCGELKRSLGITGKQVVGIVGRLAYQKGQTILLDAFAEVVKKVPSTMLFIIGDGPDKAELREKAKRLGLDKCMCWFGALPQEEVFRLYSMMDVFVMPSLYEGFGLCAAEALSAGKAVVASNVEGLSEIVQEGINGLLVPPGDKEALSGAIIKLLSDPTKAALMGARGRQLVRKDFSLERFQSTILTAYTHFSQT